MNKNKDVTLRGTLSETYIFKRNLKYYSLYIINREHELMTCLNFDDF